MEFVYAALIVAIVGAVILQGLRKIPASPPHKGQATFLGRRVRGWVYKEGWGIYPFYPYVFGFILVKTERINFEVVSEKTRTPDRAESRIPVSLTICPLPDLLIEYIDSGQEKGVKEQITGRVKERVREWAMGSEEGPADWVELNMSQLEATSVLVRKIAGPHLTKIPEYAQEVPTWIWLRYFGKPKPTKFLTNEQIWAEENWKRVRAVLSQIKRKHGPNAVKELETAVEGRRNDIEALSIGTGNIVLRDLGIVLQRLNLGDIDVTGKVGDQAEDEAMEEQQRLKEQRELQFVRERISELMQPPYNYTRQEARDIVQTERGKVTRTIEDKNIALDPATAAIAGNIAGNIVGRK